MFRKNVRICEDEQLGEGFPFSGACGLYGELEPQVRPVGAVRPIMPARNVCGRVPQDVTRDSSRGSNAGGFVKVNRRTKKHALRLRAGTSGRNARFISRSQCGRFRQGEPQDEETRVRLRAGTRGKTRDESHVTAAGGFVKVNRRMKKHALRLRAGTRGKTRDESHVTAAGGFVRVNRWMKKHALRLRAGTRGKTRDESRVTATRLR